MHGELHLRGSRRSTEVWRSKQGLSLGGSCRISRVSTPAEGNAALRVCSSSPFAEGGALHTVASLSVWQPMDAEAPLSVRLADDGLTVEA